MIFVFLRMQDGCTALMVAAEHGGSSSGMCALYLLSAKAEMNIRDNVRIFHVHFDWISNRFIFLSSLVFVLFLFRACADARAYDRGDNIHVPETQNGNTALMVATAKGHKDMMEIFIANRSDKNVRNNVRAISVELIAVVVQY